MYEIPNILELLQKPPLSKEAFKELVITKITTHHESELWDEALRNSKMTYFNVSTHSLRGKPHPALSCAVTTTQVKELRPAVKMLIRDLRF